MSEPYRIKVDKDRIIGQINPQIYGYLAEHMGRLIYGGLYDEGSPLSDDRGFRKDVLEALKRTGCSNLRWPGGNFTSFYHWEDGVGPKEDRPVKYDLAWRVEESNRFGTDEFIQYCRAVGAEPYICANVSRQSTPEEAAHWVEYCNRKGDSHYAKMRERNGYPEPHNVKYWGIGSEVTGRGKGNFTPAEYASLLEEYVTLMKRVDPTIKTVAVGIRLESSPTKKEPRRTERLETLLKQAMDWDSEVLKKAGDLIDYISMHQYYSPEDYYGTVAAPVDVEDMVTRLRNLIEVSTTGFAREEPIRIAFDEWGFGWQLTTSMLDHKVWASRIVASLKRFSPSGKYRLESVHANKDHCDCLVHMFDRTIDCGMFQRSGYLAWTCRPAHSHDCADTDHRCARDCRRGSAGAASPVSNRYS